MGFLKRTNKKFDYQPRFYKGEGNPYKMEHKFDEFRTTVGKEKGLKSKFTNAFEELKNSDVSSNKILFMIVGVLVFIFLYIIDFDLSIFF